uniref:Uncharacterized protein n=1 Tax=Penaeus semisulcatus majanivirus TaxID=2984274 RepID=A0A9C7F074_9VIRU|nr:MAG: hypothetical protein [Penaeus semisulcatus majanivirus]
MVPGLRMYTRRNLSIWLFMSSILLLYSHQANGRYYHKTIKLDPTTTYNITIRRNPDGENKRIIAACGFCDSYRLKGYTLKACDPSAQDPSTQKGCGPSNQLHFTKEKQRETRHCQCKSEASGDEPNVILQHVKISLSYDTESNTADEEFLYVLNFDSMTLIRAPFAWNVHHSIGQEEDFLRWIMKWLWSNEVKGISCAFRSHRLSVDTVTTDDDDDDDNDDDDNDDFDADAVLGTYDYLCDCNIRSFTL